MKPPSKMEQKSIRLNEREDQLWEKWFNKHHEDTLYQLHEVIYKRVRILDQITTFSKQ